MRKKVYGLTFVLLLLFSAVAGLLLVDSATAFFNRPYMLELTIKSDGSIMVCQVSPSYEEFQAPDLINRTGNVYTLTADVEEYAVVIKRSNIVFDGAGHTIHAPFEWVNSSLEFENSGLRLEEVNNVVVKNLEVIGENPTSIFLVGSNCLVTNVKTQKALSVNSELGSNTITESNITKLVLWRGNNLVSKCNISSIFLADWSGSNVFTQNNFLSNNSTDGFPVETYSGNFWDNGSMGNYWGDYLTKYPNASEIGNTGIGNTPYVIDADNIDHYPLMAPVDNTAPAIVVLSPAPGTYNASNIQLSFTVDEPASLIAYSLDGKENITITENITLTGLTNGVHNLTIYAKDKAGNIEASETIYFDVDTPEPFPTLLVATASGVAISGVSVCLLYYFKKRNH